MSYLSIIQRKYFEAMDDREKEFTSMVKEKAESMINLIDDLMTYSSMNGKEHNERTMKKIDIREIIEKAEDNLKIEIEKSKPKIIKPNFMPSLYANENQIISLFQNLIGNALKYKKKDIKPRIEINIEDYNNKMWKISVKDNGIGIEKEKHKSIFNMYSRAHNDGKYIGHGIGLSFCKKIINKHSGDIWVDSTPGIGSTFYFTLPKLKSEDNIDNKDTQIQNN
jgi:light-regulated signal transduction histidine kinase (bacteriophytochrome)